MCTVLAEECVCVCALHCNVKILLSAWGTIKGAPHLAGTCKHKLGSSQINAVCVRVRVSLCLLVWDSPHTCASFEVLNHLLHASCNLSGRIPTPHTHTVHTQTWWARPDCGPCCGEVLWKRREGARESESERWRSEAEKWKKAQARRVGRAHNDEERRKARASGSEGGTKVARESSKGRAPCCLGTRAETGEVPEWFKSPGRNCRWRKWSQEVIWCPGNLDRWEGSS